MKICSVEGCDGESKQRGFCIKHYTRFRKHGSPFFVQRIRSDSGICSVDGCTKKHLSKGFCKNHARAFQKYGDPLGKHVQNTFVSELILNNIDYNGDDCLLWPYARNSAGYGVARIDGKNEYVHVIICTIKHGPKPSCKHVVRHLCGRGHDGCYSPNCVVWSTESENQIDRVTHGTSNRGEAQGRSKLTRGDVFCIIEDDRKYIEIAEQYNITENYVYILKSGRSWNWLTNVKEQPNDG